MRAHAHLLRPQGFFLLVFAILGVEFFGGKLGQCEIGAIANRSACEAAYAMLADGGGGGGLVNRTAIWYNPDIGDFDNVVGAMLLLFEMITAEMWPDVLHMTSDASA
eukprot:4324939-Prymnesium_polylepis.1